VEAKVKGPNPKKRLINPKAARFRLRIGRSTLQGYGVFALEEILAGRRVIEYTGKRITRLKSWTILAPEDNYIADMNSRWSIDGRTGGSGAQFINHSCRPNLKWRCSRGRLYFYSCRKICAGEELTVKYRYQVKVRRIPCHCGARRCQGTLRLIFN
jgi:SET domain-containing protein